MSKPTNAFDHLVARILAGACTPFLGAGISGQSKKKGEKWTGHQGWDMVRKVMAPAVRNMWRRLDSGDRNLCPDCSHAFASMLGIPIGFPPLTHCQFCDLRRIKAGNKLAEACEAFIWEFGELQQDDQHYLSLAETLEIAEFADLDPTPAHVYLAYLAREGLITEFITTNYDCNLEKAYLATFAPDATDASVDAITSLEEYTRLAGKRSQPQPGEDTRHRPKLYKINGCAQKLKDNKEEAKNILLTEAQLQNWRTRHWAEDLFRVKFRSGCVVLVGFGHEEPQIRHTVQQVLEEYSRDGRRGRRLSSLFDHPNAPVVTLYGRFPSFPQRQLIHGFAQWMGFSGGDGEKLLCGPDQFHQRFPTWQKSELTADTCWEYVYREVFIHLVNQALDHAAAKENAAFTGAVPEAKRLLRHVRAQCNEATNTTRAFLICGHRDGTGLVYLPRLICLLNCLLHQHNSACRYTAVNDHRSLVAELATLVWLLHRIGGKQAALQVHWHDPVLAFELTGQALDSRLRLFVSNGQDRQHGQQPAVQPVRAPVALHLCLGANGSRAKPESVRLLLEDGVIRVPIDVAHLAWRHLFPEDMPIHSALHDIPERLKDAMRHPGKFLRRAESSLRRRPYLKEIQP